MHQLRSSNEESFLAEAPLAALYAIWSYFLLVCRSSTDSWLPSRQAANDKLLSYNVWSVASCTVRTDVFIVSIYCTDWLQQRSTHILFELSWIIPETDNGLKIVQQDSPAVLHTLIPSMQYSSAHSSICTMSDTHDLANFVINKSKPFLPTLLGESLDFNTAYSLLHGIGDWQVNNMVHTSVHKLVTACKQKIEIFDWKVPKLVTKMVNIHVHYNVLADMVQHSNFVRIYATVWRLQYLKHYHQDGNSLNVKCSSSSLTTRDLRQ